MAEELVGVHLSLSEMRRGEQRSVRFEHASDLDEYRAHFSSGEVVDGVVGDDGVKCSVAKWQIPHIPLAHWEPKRGSFAGSQHSE